MNTSSPSTTYSVRRGVQRSPSATSWRRRGSTPTARRGERCWPRRAVEPSSQVVELPSDHATHECIHFAACEPKYRSGSVLAIANADDSIREQRQFQTLAGAKAEARFDPAGLGRGLTRH